VIIAQANCPVGRRSYSVHMHKQAFDDDNPSAKKMDTQLYPVCSS
jgi:hypothetical protein